MTCPSQAAAPPEAPARDATFDILKGIGILEVILHHVLSYSARKFAVEGAPEWWALMVANRIFHFAVPTFLLASALLLARSLSRRAKPDWRRFYLRRGERTLWPYAVWSLVYVVFRLVIVRVGSDVEPTMVTVAGAWTLTVPALVGDPSGWTAIVLWGKAYYHLYFMSVLLQFSLAFPLLYYGTRRLRAGFGAMLLVATLLQAGAFWLYGRVLAPVFGFAAPGSTVLWYLPAVLMGVWLGLMWGRWPTAWQTWRWPLVAAAATGLAVYLTMALRQILGLPYSSLWLNSGNTLYATGVALLLLAASGRLARGPVVGPWLARVGDWSLPLFLLHPMVLHLLSGPTIGGFLDELPCSPLVAGALTLALTWGFASLAGRLRVDRLLFGRTLLSPRLRDRGAPAGGRA